MATFSHAKFFNQTRCDRCGNLLITRIMSCFSEECICPGCMKEELEGRNELAFLGYSTPEGKAIKYLIGRRWN